MSTIEPDFPGAKIHDTRLELTRREVHRQTIDPVRSEYFGACWTILRLTQFWSSSLCPFE